MVTKQPDTPQQQNSIAHYWMKSWKRIMKSSLHRSISTSILFHNKGEPPSAPMLKLYELEIIKIGRLLEIRLQQN